MDGSPLILAQTHARKASKANTPAAAIEEHDLAAGHFASAAIGTKNSEALRTLKLLEQHHEKLSQLLKFQTSHPVLPKIEAPHEPPEAVPAPIATSAKIQDANPPRSSPQSVQATHRSQRDNSSSIAGTLASARGIPTNKQRRGGQLSSPAVAQQNAEGKMVPPARRQPANTTRDEAFPSEKTPPAQSTPSTLPSSKETPTEEPPKPSDDAFNRFYTTFESLFSKLSAPLAFAGLPLNPDADDNNTTTTKSPATPGKTPATPPSKSSRSGPTTSSRRATAEPAYSQLFSPAALAAVREEPGNAGALGAPGESFYVVPTTGGSAPYASILARQQRDHHHTRTLSRDSTGLSGEDVDEFVDARESPGGGGSDSPVMRRSGRGGGGSEDYGGAYARERLATGGSG